MCSNYNLTPMGNNQTQHLLNVTFYCTDRGSSGNFHQAGQSLLQATSHALSPLPSPLTVILSGILV